MWKLLVHIYWRIVPHNHGTSEMEHIETTPETFGSYQIYECRLCGVREAL